MVSIRPGPVTVGGVELGNHLLLAAGILGTTWASLSRMLSLGAGGVVTKSIGPVPKDGHAGPCIAVLDDGLLNAMGLPNPSKDFIDEIAPLKKKQVIVSISRSRTLVLKETAGVLTLTNLFSPALVQSVFSIISFPLLFPDGR